MVAISVPDGERVADVDAIQESVRIGLSDRDELFDFSTDEESVAVGSDVAVAVELGGGPLPEFEIDDFELLIALRDSLKDWVRVLDVESVGASAERLAVADTVLECSALLGVSVRDKTWLSVKIKEPVSV